MRKWNGVRAGLVTGCVLLAACGDKDGAGQGDAGPAKGDTLAVTPQAADADPMGNARKLLGDGVVHAESFKLDRENERFILALVDAADELRDPVDTVPVGPGAYEVVLIEARPDAFGILKIGLIADDGRATAANGAGPRLAGSQASGRIVGVEDATGDGFGEVWTAVRRLGMRAYSVRVSAFDRLTRRTFWAAASSVQAPGALTDPTMNLPLDSASYRYSANADTVPGVRDWLARKTASVARTLQEAPAPPNP